LNCHPTLADKSAPKMDATMPTEVRMPSMPPTTMDRTNSEPTLKRVGGGAAGRHKGNNGPTES
jgi:hypothetical protein